MLSLSPALTLGTTCVLKNANSCTGKLRQYKEISNYADTEQFPQLTGMYKTDARYSPPRYSAPTFCDLNGDGNDDLIAGAHTVNKLEYFTTGTNGKFTQQSGVDNPFEFIVVPDNPFESAPNSHHLRAAFFDSDKDGDYDFVLTVYHAATRYFENVGSRTVPSFVEKVGVIENPFHSMSIGTRNPVFADLDGDGDQDYIVGLGNKFYYYENTGIPNKSAFTHRTGIADPFHLLTVGSYAAPAFHDIDDDGDLDFIAASFYTISYYENSGSTYSPAFTQRMGEGMNPFHNSVELNYIGSVMPSFMRTSSNTYFVTGSAQHRPNPNVATWKYFGKLFYLEQNDDPLPRHYQKLTGAGMNPFSSAMESDLGNNLIPRFHDLNGDGLIDVLLGSRNNLHILLNKGTAENAFFVKEPFPGTTISSSEYLAPAIADLNGDSLADILVGTNFGDFLYFENVGSATSPNFLLRDGALNPMSFVSFPSSVCERSDNRFRSAPALFDVDFDGLVDVVVGTICQLHTDGLGYWRNTGTKTMPSFTLVTGNSNPFQTLTTSPHYASVYNIPIFYDVNGDGKPDLICGTQYLRIFVFLNTGTRASPVFQEWTLSQGNPWTKIRVGAYLAPAIWDLDADGDPDLVIGTELSTLHYYEANGCTMASTCNGRGICNGTQCGCSSGVSGKYCDSCSAGAIEEKRKGGASLVVAQNLVCQNCPVGFWSSISRNINGKCVACKPGQFSDQVGAASNTCKNCPAGEYQPNDGLPYCLPCIPVRDFLLLLRAEWMNTRQERGFF